ncbi:MAG: prepilin-type N-terminal cleavage/methylation domain-containing protein [Alphaproteobacteria bacterium]
MKTSIETLRHDQQGFTLVELAVVMIIIGLLIGGILKGQELIVNARVTATASQMESMSAAVNGFRDAYSSIPGDMSTAQNRLPNCAAATFCFNGGGDSQIGLGVGAAAADPAAGNGAQEASNFFIHLARGEFLTGVSGAAAAMAPGVTHPVTPAGGVFNVGDRTGPTASSAGFVASNNGVELTGTMWLTLVSAPATVVATNNGLLTAQQAARIDRKLDDGAPDTGSVIASNAGGAVGECVDAGAVYAEGLNTVGCSLAYSLR